MPYLPPPASELTERCPSAQGFPHYYYGVYADAQDAVLISGFVDGADAHGPVSQGVVRSSFDGGSSWNPPAIIDGKSWAGGPIRCTNASHCIVPGVSSNKLYVTNAGIASVVSDFQTVVPDPKVSWFQGPFVAVGPRNGESSAQSVVISGLGLCNSTDGGYRFSCTPPVDPTFDGGIALQMAELQSGDAPIRYGAGLVCGGEISQPMSGWVHTTADGGGKPHDHRRLTSRFCVNSPKIPGNHLFRG